MEYVDRDDYSRETVPKSEVEEGEQYVFDWSPYTWAMDNEGHTAPVKVTVKDADHLLGDVKLRTASGEVLTDLGEGRPRVMGPATNTDNVPDRTDVGTGGLYHEFEG